MSAEKDVRYGHPETARVSTELRFYSESLHDVSTSLKLMAKNATSTRCKRAELIVEEVSEILGALASGNPVELADALTDALYVIYGTGVAFGIPLETVFREVHRSNMTKDIGANKHHEGGTKGKGPDYSPPDIAGAMEKGRQDAAQLRYLRRSVEEIVRSWHAGVYIERTDCKSVKIDAGEAHALGTLL